MKKRLKESLSHKKVVHKKDGKLKDTLCLCGNNCCNESSNMNLAGNISKASMQHGNIVINPRPTDICNCNTNDDWCLPGYYCQYSEEGQSDWGCGWWFLEPCNGVCTEGVNPLPPA